VYLVEFNVFEVSAVALDYLVPRQEASLFGQTVLSGALDKDAWPLLSALANAGKVYNLHLNFQKKKGEVKNLCPLLLHSAFQKPNFGFRKLQNGSKARLINKRKTCVRRFETFDLWAIQKMRNRTGAMQTPANRRT